MQQQPRQTSVGMYVLGEELGRGGMGAVFVGEHTVLKRRVAIKLLLGEHTSDADMRIRFLREARAVARLHHPNLVPVIDFGELEGGTPYFVSELVGGESLRSRLKREVSLPVNRAVAFAVQIARGLSCAHAAGIVHRDLKPSNVMVVADPEAPFGERVKILDFGVAKISKLEGGDDSELTQTGALVGTPGFMSPEQCRGVGEVDHRSDIYSLGVLLYLMLAGRPTFVGDGLGEVLAMHIYLPPTPLTTQFVDVPRDLDAIIMRCLAKRPSDRHASMHDLIADLEALGALSPLPLTATAPAPRTLVLPLPAPLPTPPPRSSMMGGEDETVQTLDDLPLSRRAAALSRSNDDLLAPYEDVDAPKTVPATSVASAKPRRRRILALTIGVALAGGIAAWLPTRSTGLDDLPSITLPPASAGTVASVASVKEPSAPSPVEASPVEASPAALASQPTPTAPDRELAVVEGADNAALVDDARADRVTAKDSTRRKPSRIAARSASKPRAKESSAKENRSDLPRSSDRAPAASATFERPVF